MWTENYLRALGTKRGWTVETMLEVICEYVDDLDTDRVLDRALVKMAAKDREPYDPSLRELPDWVKDVENGVFPANILAAIRESVRNDWIVDISGDICADTLDGAVAQVRHFFSNVCEPETWCPLTWAIVHGDFVYVVMLAQAFRLFGRTLINCGRCKLYVPLRTAHLHAETWIGDECGCWEQLEHEADKVH